MGKTGSKQKKNGKSAQEPKKKFTTLLVIVRDPTGDPIDRIKVEVKDGSDDLTQGATNEDGEVLFHGLERGLTVTIWVNDENTRKEVDLDKAQAAIVVEYDGEYEPVEDGDGSDDEEDEDDAGDPDELEGIDLG